MKIAILDLTTHPEPELTGMPRIYEQIEAWLKPAFPEADLTPYDIAEMGQKLPRPDEFDGLLVSGSESGVYDETPWMQPLRQLLVDTKAAGKPIFGVCFGHQIMADVFGGKAEKSSAGNQVGARTYKSNGNTFEAFAWHQDQVTKVPPSAEITATSSNCPVAGLAYDFPAASVQFHPEYRKDHLQKIYGIFRGSFIPEDIYQDAIETVTNSSVPIDLQAKETAEFFRRHAGS